jgi:hypothetical protein
METEQMMARLLAEMKASQEEMNVEIRTNNEKFEVLRGTHLQDGYPPSQDRGRARKNGCQPKGNENQTGIKSRS